MELLLKVFALCVITAAVAPPAPAGAALPPLRTVPAIALTVRVGGAFCRDAAQGALASVLETAGAVCALTAAAPLLLAVVELVEGWL